MRRVLAWGFAGGVLATACFAGETVIGLRDVAAVQDGRGSARVLFRPAALPAFEGVTVESARLTIPYSGEVDPRRLELRVCPVTERWQGNGRWDTAFDRELYARATLDLRRGGGVMTFDLKVALREMAEYGLSTDGFVLTAVSASGGLPVGDLSRLGSLSGAMLRIETSQLPSGRPSAEWLARRGR
jgi:hypothetical protein